MWLCFAGAPKPDNLRSFVFKCHRYVSVRFLRTDRLSAEIFRLDREENDIFSINCLAFHPRNTFVSAASDGILSFWDKDVK